MFWVRLFNGTVDLPRDFGEKDVFKNNGHILSEGDADKAVGSFFL